MEQVAVIEGTKIEIIFLGIQNFINTHFGAKIILGLQEQMSFWVPPYHTPCVSGLHTRWWYSVQGEGIHDFDWLFQSGLWLSSGQIAVNHKPLYLRIVF